MCNSIEVYSEDKLTRNALFEDNSETGLVEVVSDSSSIFSIGTLAGMSFCFESFPKYLLRNDIVTLHYEGNGFFDRNSFITTVLPSICIYSSDKLALSVIAPFNIGDNNSVNAGFGISIGSAITKSIEVGFALVLIGVDNVYLTEEQKLSLKSGLPLDNYAIKDFSTHVVPALAFGVYLCPRF